MIDDRVYISESGIASMLEKDDEWEMVDSQHTEDVEDVDRGQQRKDGAKDRLWPIAALREVHTRRSVILSFLYNLASSFVVFVFGQFLRSEPFQYDPESAISPLLIFSLCFPGSH